MILLPHSAIRRKPQSTGLSQYFSRLRWHSLLPGCELHGVVTLQIGYGRCKSGSTLDQAMACCLTAPTHYLNQCQLLIGDVLRHSSESNFTASAAATILYSEVEQYTATSPKVQWVNSSPISAAYMRQWIAPALLQIMDCRLFGAKPLSEPTLGYCQSNP